MREARPGQQGTAIATWFVADAPGEATFFPQVGSRSDAPAAQAVYWRCVAVFYASSLALNPAARHVFFTNTAVPAIDGLDLAAWFARRGIAVVTLPVTWRLPAGRVGSWGNQFYVFDILEHWAATGAPERLVLLDSDCLWRRPVDDLAAAIDRHGALTYRLGADEHPEDAPINGLSREGMARFAARHGSVAQQSLAYCGGEIFAASAPMVARIAARARELRPAVLAGEPDGPCEEAHLLSITYALEGVPVGTADPFIRRMWTTFHHHNLRVGDGTLAIWHLPAEKRTGFADLFRLLAADPDRNGFDAAVAARAMGWPRRGLRKFVRDLALKLAEKLRG